MSGNRGRGSHTQTASSLPVDDSTLPYTAATTQEALEQTITASGASRLPVTLAYNGNASNKWLEIFASISSDSVPFLMAEPGVVRTLALTTNGTSTVTVTLYKNGVLLDTISLTAATGASKLTSHTLLAGDKISAKVTDGSASNPIFCVTIQVSA